MTILSMSDLNLDGKKVLIRVDLNVPLEDGKVSNTQRIEAILPTLKLAQEQNARIMLMSHLGRPKEGKFDPEFSLAPVAYTLSQLINYPVVFVEDWIDKDIAVAKKEIILFENVRFLQGEKDNDPVLSEKMAKHCEIFVMDAFATAHRKEASTFGVAEFAPVSCAGPLLVRELNALKKIMEKPEHPLIAIVGGSKVSSKLVVLESLLEKVDVLIVGGGIANTFLAAQGYPVGKSLYEPELVAVAKQLLETAAKKGIKIPLPSDVVVAKELSKHTTSQIKSVRDVSSDDMILDFGPQTTHALQSEIKKAKTILWNGPIGVFEFDAFSKGTQALATAIAASTAYSVAGGGDTLAAIDKYQLAKQISYISTGGGAFLEYIEGKELPAVTILKRSTSRCEIE